MANIYSLEKLTLLKLVAKVISQKENLNKCNSFEEQKCTRHIQGNIHFGIILFSCSLSTKICLRFVLICFAWKIKTSYQSSLGNEVDFIDI